MLLNKTKFLIWHLSEKSEGGTRWPISEANTNKEGDLTMWKDLWKCCFQ